jgi:hypothetical protein
LVALGILSLSGFKEIHQGFTLLGQGVSSQFVDDLQMFHSCCED